MERDALDLGTKHVGRLFRKFFVPTLLGMLSISAVTVADGIFVGHGVGSDGIAAINICYAPVMIFAAGFVCFVVNLAAIGYYQSLERVRPATFFALLRGCVFLVPCFVLLPRWFGVAGIWLAMPLSEGLTLLALGAYWRRRS